MSNLDIIKLAVQSICNRLGLNIQIHVMLFKNSRDNLLKSYSNNDTIYIDDCTLTDGESLLKIILHEIVHIIANNNGINCTSQNGRYHNKRFREVANSIGINTNYIESRGHCDIIIPDTFNDIIYKLDQYIVSKNINKKIEIENNKLSKKSKCSTRKYVCPICKNSIRATKELNIICGDCKVFLVKAETLEQTKVTHKDHSELIKYIDNMNWLTQSSKSYILDYLIHKGVYDLSDIGHVKNEIRSIHNSYVINNKLFLTNKEITEYLESIGVNNIQSIKRDIHNGVENAILSNIDGAYINILGELVIDTEDNKHESK